MEATRNIYLKQKLGDKWDGVTRAEKEIDRWKRNSLVQELNRIAFAEGKVNEIQYPKQLISFKEVIKLYE